MIIRLTHVDHLETLYLVMESKVNLGSFGVTGVKRSFSLKYCNSSMLHCMIIKPIHVDYIETFYISNLVKSQSGVIWVHWGSRNDFHQN